MGGREWSGGREATAAERTALRAGTSAPLKVREPLKARARRECLGGPSPGAARREARHVSTTRRPRREARSSTPAVPPVRRLHMVERSAAGGRGGAGRGRRGRVRAAARSAACSMRGSQVPRWELDGVHGGRLPASHLPARRGGLGRAAGGAERSSRRCRSAPVLATLGGAVDEVVRGHGRAGGTRARGRAGGPRRPTWRAGHAERGSGEPLREAVGTIGERAVRTRRHAAERPVRNAAPAVLAAPPPWSRRVADQVVPALARRRLELGHVDHVTCPATRTRRSPPPPSATG